MRGSDGKQEGLFTVSKLEDFVPADYTPRAIRLVVNQALAQLNGLFNDIYADSGRSSIAPRSCCARCSSRSFSRCAASAS
jgi:hypothetical protein